MSRIVCLLLALAALASAQTPGFRPYPLNIRTGIPSYIGHSSSPYLPLAGINPYRVPNLERQAYFSFNKPDQYLPTFNDASGQTLASFRPEAKSIPTPFIADPDILRFISNDLPADPFGTLVSVQPARVNPDAAAKKAAKLRPLPKNLPIAQATSDTDEVAAAKLRHLKLWNEAKRRAALA